MSEVAWQTLADKGVEVLSNVSGLWVQMDYLDLDTALRVAIALTLQLDSLGQAPSYSEEDLPFDWFKAKAEERLNKGSLVFGEMRPADRNCAVRVQSWLDGGFRLIADIRNDFYDRPELDGARKLQQKFTETIELMDL